MRILGGGLLVVLLASMLAWTQGGIGVFPPGGTGAGSGDVVAGGSNTFTGSNDFSGGQIRLKTGTAAPTGTDCDAAGETGRVYIRTGAPSGTVNSLYQCQQTGASTYGWVSTTHQLGTTAPTVCAVGDLFFDSDATAGNNWFGCTATNTWTLLGGAGSGITEAFAANTVTTYSATPTFTVPSATREVSFKITLTGNVTSSTLASPVNGQQIRFIVCQDATGGRSFVWPTTVIGGITISATRNSVANTCYGQDFVYDGTNARSVTGPEFTVGSVGGLECTNALGGCDIATAVVPRKAATETITGAWSFTGILATPYGTAAPTAGDCDAAGEAGRVYIETDQTTGRKIWVCDGTSWNQQGGGTATFTQSDAYYPCFSNGAASTTGERAANLYLPATPNDAVFEGFATGTINYGACYVYMLQHATDWKGVILRGDLSDDYSTTGQSVDVSFALAIPASSNGTSATFGVASACLATAQNMTTINVTWNTESTYTVNGTVAGGLLYGSVTGIAMGPCTGGQLAIYRLRRLSGGTMTGVIQLHNARVKYKRG